MSQTIYNEFAALGVSIVRVLDDLKIIGPDSILTDETYLVKLRDNKDSLLTYIQSLENDELIKNQGLGVATAALVDNVLTFTYTDGTVASLGNVKGDTGKGVLTAGLSGENLRIEFDDGTVFDLGDVVGDKGETGSGLSFGSSWASGISYAENAIVKKDGKVYIASPISGFDIGTSTNKGKSPETETNYWDVLIDMNDSTIDGGEL
ncbi:MAG: hypothetical protein H8D80_02455 [Proteobacteria bacterium]|nr:hypothetical protein [Pseudomonadota bacterium]